MWSIIKTLSAVLLMLCMFLPLSQCSKQSTENLAEPEQLTTSVSYHQALSYDLLIKFDWRHVVPAFVFMLPFLLCLFNAFRIELKAQLGIFDRGWTVFILELLSSSLILSLIVGHLYFATPMIGLFITLICLAVYVIADIICFKRRLSC